MYESTCSIQCMLLCKISYSVRSCVVYVKYCNHLLAVDMANVVAICRGLACAYACGWKNVKRYRDGSPQRYCGVAHSYLV